MRAKASRLADKLMFAIWVTTIMSQRISRLLVHLPPSVTFNMSQLERRTVAHFHLSSSVSPWYSPPVNFLVTGGAGFIGSHVCERLLNGGHSVWAFDDLNTFYDPQLKRRNIRDIQALAKPFEFVHGDISDRAALDALFSSVKFDQVIHLAARAGEMNHLVKFYA